MCLVHVVQEKQFQAIKTKFDFYYKDQINSQNGFWFKSILRFLFIEAWIIHNNYDVGDFIHLEADCISLIDKDLYAFVRNNYDKISVPVNILGNCIPSVVYFPSGNHAIELSEYIKARINEAIDLPEFYCNDIAMLNEFKYMNKISSLPSLPENSINSNGEMIIFDPAYIGEYLFGKDVRHNKFILKSGSITIQEYVPILERMIFNLNKSKKDLLRINLEYENRQYMIANIHNFSKRYDLFSETVRIKQFEKIINEINTKGFIKKIAISQFIYFLIDKFEYNTREILNRYFNKIK
jgi:hypothetical protein